MVNLMENRAIAFCHPERSEGSPGGLCGTPRNQYDRHFDCEVPVPRLRDRNDNDESTLSKF